MGFFSSLFGDNDDSAFNSNEVVQAIRANDFNRLARVAVDNFSLLKFENRLNLIESDGHTFLSRLLANGQGELAKYVMNFGARIDVRLPNGKLVGQMNSDKSIRGYLDAIHFIMTGNIGANDVVTFNAGNVPHTPVMWMTKLGYYYGLKYFLSARLANPNKCYGNSNTPLMIATEMGYAHFIDLLVAYGANIDQSDDDGWTALSFAAANIDHVPNGLGVSARALLRNGADVNHRNNRGETPLALATRYGNDVVASILQNAGASV